MMRIARSTVLAPSYLAALLFALLAFASAPLAAAGEEKAAAEPAKAQPIPGPDATGREAPGMSEEKSHYMLRLAPSYWMPFVSGTIGAQGISEHMDLDVSDTTRQAEDGKFPVCFMAELRRSRFSIFNDLNYVNLVDREESGGNFTDAEFRQFMTTFGGGMDLYSWREAGAESVGFTLGGRIAGRYVKMVTKVETGPGAPEDGEDDKDWIEPVLGVYLSVTPAEQVRFLLDADLGGFGVGSDITWGIQGLFEYRIWEFLYLAAGYRAIDIKYSDGHDASRFRFDAIEHGPIVTIAIEF